MSLIKWMVDVISTEIMDELPGSEVYKTERERQLAASIAESSQD